MFVHYAVMESVVMFHITSFSSISATVFSEETQDVSCVLFIYFHLIKAVLISAATLVSIRCII